LRCSATEAWIAAYGKEPRDLFTSGDASTEDLRADRAGITCAKETRDVDALGACCAAAGY
jgi:hypothetical protein